ncbi:rhamnan synthesis F family protein [Halomonas caseinilytica]|uniref:rhamnan synthesis F family protein n=1 Tax=Halomonas caseinilytica TaxID=438744 RepID=UPI0007E55367|nr:rhamnan synthesis F family protein [Halomonas caseinilytica]SEN44432.1 Haloacid dehalogenase-like hydrolase [Halomonas caseinilytica]
MFKSIKSLSTRLKAGAGQGIDYEQLTEEAVSLGLFNPSWYQEHYGRTFPSNVEAFKDYVRKSRFSPVNPSPAFDNETYHRTYMDVFHGQVSPLLHYLMHGRQEGRRYAPYAPRWMPRNVLTPEREVNAAAQELKVAACLHIFYDDFIDRFAQALNAFPIELDILLTLANDSLVEHARRTFGKHPKVKNLEIRVVPNRGRNFGPMLVEYAEKLREYDLFCHLHSKKSLYSGKEQTQWADYLTEYILRDPAVTSGILNSFADNSELGVYYPTTFWMMPTWVNHLTMNVPFVRALEEEFDLPRTSGFLSYPAGGMFWARPQALKDLLSKQWTYEDFPEEPLPNDGSMLHALERVLGKAAQKRGYGEFFYYPPTGQFTRDHSYTFSSYQGSGLNQHLPAIQAHECISFDVFDTLVRREYTAPDYAKLKLGQQLATSGLVGSAQEFVKIRNRYELALRKKADFSGDVSIKDVYGEVGKALGISDHEAADLMQEEFELDLKMIRAKDEMVELFNHLGSIGHKLWVISDTYYTRGQVGLMLKKAGVSVPYRLLVSSEEQKRKDNGTMWRMVKEDLANEGIQRYLHIGDNVVADAQLPGDLGLTTFHILHPMDKWQALGFPDVLQGDEALDEHQILKWGKLVSQVGRNPFIGE